MSPEEYQRIKEAEKEHLRKLKQLKDAVHLLKRRQSVNQALDKMTGGPQGMLDTHADMIDKLALETAQHEARLEIALENAELGETSAPTPDTQSATSRTTEQDEEALLEARAKTLLRQIKMEMGVPSTSDDTPKSVAKQERPSAPEDTTNPPEPTELPEKTIGRMR